jgi:hypothetical protein
MCGDIIYINLFKKIQPDVKIPRFHISYPFDVIFQRATCVTRLRIVTFYRLRHQLCQAGLLMTAHDVT